MSDNIMQLPLPESSSWPGAVRPLRSSGSAQVSVPVTRLPEKPYIIVHDFSVVRIVAKCSARILRGHSLNRYLVPHWREQNRRRFVLYEEIADRYPSYKRRQLDKQLAVLVALGYLEVKYLGHRRCYRVLKAPVAT